MEISTISIFLLGIIPMLIIVASLRHKSRVKSEKRRPPGPRGLPFIGSLHHVLTSQPQAALRDLAKKHGPVMYLKLGQVDTVVISSPAAAREIICYGCHDIAFAPYGAYWLVLRKLCTIQLLNTSKVKQFASIRNRETMSLVKEIYSTSGKTVNLGSLLVSSSFPFLDVVTGTKRRLQRAHLQLEGVTDKIIAECEARRKERKAKNSEGQEVQGEDDLLSVLLRIHDEDEFEIPIKITTIKAIIQAQRQLHQPTIELMRNPDTMVKAQKEVRQAFDHKCPYGHESLMGELHYTRMVIKETLRLHPPLPLLLPCLCRETCDIGGFKVNKGTRVIVNAWAMARSSEYWDNAEEFKSERFKNSIADYTGTQFEYLPFGSGRRLCPGIGFALSTLELIVARLLYYFNWSLPHGMQPEELDMDTTVGATARRTNPLHLVASPYKVPIEH
ncbi:hypothetical protein SETIT_9G272200v2 [Setaria italica]|uniref:Cytochrome P450 n=1 Tax=Setaria italica TaxID=4555 RepID=A0A368SL86_SETIT|nr:hypothetical protein SETIT_9G272200v2 [Setaria italica]